MKGDFTIEFPQTPQKILVEVKQTKIGKNWPYCTLKFELHNHFDIPT